MGVHDQYVLLRQSWLGLLKLFGKVVHLDKNTLVAEESSLSFAYFCLFGCKLQTRRGLVSWPQLLGDIPHCQCKFCKVTGLIYISRWIKRKMWAWNMRTSNMMMIRDWDQRSEEFHSFKVINCLFIRQLVNTVLIWGSSFTPTWLGILRIFYCLRTYNGCGGGHCLSNMCVPFKRI